ncbi:MAG: hypothetical protein HY565_03110 [Candidatus Kerfeldbacteria bacterium]|nr:hypothetical protein [Candidatus Kerfeldbacteria bacterium]
MPTVLIMGGGTGAQAINDLVSPELVEFTNVILVTGPNKSSASSVELQRSQRFHGVELLKENFAEALHKADLVVCRAGFGTITELAAVGKASILIPIPQSHQEANAGLLVHKQAAVVLQQDQLTPAKLVDAIKATFKVTASLEENIKTIFPVNATITLCQIIERLGNSSR